MMLLQATGLIVMIRSARRQPLRMVLSAIQMELFREAVKALGALCQGRAKDRKLWTTANAN